MSHDTGISGNLQESFRDDTASTLHDHSLIILYLFPYQWFQYPGKISHLITQVQNLFCQPVGCQKNATGTKD